MARSLALAKKAPKAPGVGAPKSYGLSAPIDPTTPDYDRQVSELMKEGYEYSEATKIVDEQFKVEPLAFRKGGLVGSKPKPKAKVKPKAKPKGKK
jgi:hypothetical protein